MSVETFHDDVRSAFRAAILEWRSALQGAPQALDLENEDFTPVLGTPYLRERQTVVYSRATSLHVEEHVILCTAAIFHPSGQGTQVIGRQAGNLLSAIPVGRKLEFGPSSVWVMKAERRSHLIEPGWVSVPLIFEVMGHTYR